jgi:hypothetical protein
MAAACRRGVARRLRLRFSRHSRNRAYRALARPAGGADKCLGARFTCSAAGDDEIDAQRRAPILAAVADIDTARVANEVRSDPSGTRSDRAAAGRGSPRAAGLRRCAARGRAAAPPTVSVTTVHPASVPITIELPGRTSAFLVAQVRARVDGIVLKRDYREGDDVKAGAAPLPDRSGAIRRALNSARAALQKAKANLVSTTALAERYRTSSRRTRSASRTTTTRCRARARPRPTWPLPKRRSRRRASISATPTSSRRSPAAPACRRSPRAPTCRRAPPR